MYNYHLKITILKFYITTIITILNLLFFIGKFLGIANGAITKCVKQRIKKKKTIPKTTDLPISRAHRV